MNEKIYKKVTGTGIVNLVIGITVLLSGITCGVFLLISGARLLRSKKDVMI